MSINNIIYWVVVIYICYKLVINMNKIDEYFYSIFVLVLCFIPPSVALILFDHSFIKQSDILMELGIWKYAVVIIIYSSVLLLVAFIDLPLIHPKVLEFTGVELTGKPSEWKIAGMHFFINAAIAFIITYFHRKSLFIDFIKWSAIVSFINIAILLIEYMLLEKLSKNNN